MKVCLFDHPALLMISFMEAPDVAAAVAEAALMERALNCSLMPESQRDFFIQ